MTIEETLSRVNDFKLMNTGCNHLLLTVDAEVMPNWKQIDLMPICERLIVPDRPISEIYREFGLNYSIVQRIYRVVFGWGKNH